MTIFLLEYAEQAMLAGLRVALRLLRVVHGLVEHRHQLRAAAKRIHGAALDQRFQHALVQQPQVNFFAELINRFEVPAVSRALLASLSGERSTQSRCGRHSSPPPGQSESPPHAA